MARGALLLLSCVVGLCISVPSANAAPGEETVGWYSDGSISAPQSDGAVEALSSSTGVSVSLFDPAADLSGWKREYGFSSWPIPIAPGTYGRGDLTNLLDDLRQGSGSAYGYLDTCFDYYEDNSSRIDVKRLEWGPNGEVRRFWATLEHGCGAQGEVRVGIPDPTPNLIVGPKAARFAERPVGATSSTRIGVLNREGVSVGFEAARVVGRDARDFNVASDGCDSTTLDFDERCEIRVTFTPREPGPRVAALAFEDSMGRTHRVDLDGVAHTGTTGLIERPTGPDAEKYSPLEIDPGDARFEAHHWYGRSLIFEALEKDPDNPHDLARLDFFTGDQQMREGETYTARVYGDGRSSEPSIHFFAGAGQRIGSECGGRGQFTVEELRVNRTGEVKAAAIAYDMTCADGEGVEGEVSFRAGADPGTAPERVRGLTVERSGTTANVSWTSPDDADRVIVNYLEADGAPDLPDAGIRAYVGSERSAQITGLDPGTPLSVAAFAVGDNGRVSRASSTSTAVPVIETTTPEESGRSPAPLVRGDAEQGRTVRVFTNELCAGEPVVVVPAAQFATGVPVPVAENAETHITAQAVGSGGRASGCSVPLTYTHDTVKPPTPELDITRPPSPSNVNEMTLYGYAEEARTVEIFEGPLCVGDPVRRAYAPRWIGVGASLDVEANSVNSWSARSTDAAGNVSDCSVGGPVYVEDSVPPEQPAWRETVPTSPSTEEEPTLVGNAPPQTRVAIFQSPNCRGFDRVLTAEELNSNGYRPNVVVGTTTFTMHATDEAGNVSECSEPIEYRRVEPPPPPPPPPPTLDGTTPSSPGSSQFPYLRGESEPGTEIAIYRGDFCFGTPFMTGSADELADRGIQVRVDPGSTTSFMAAAKREGTDYSDCSDPIEYTHTPPDSDAPRITRSDPESPSAESFLRLFGRAPSGTTVEIYAGNACEGRAVATGGARRFAEQGLRVSTDEIGRNAFTARGIDAAGTASSCSAEFEYRRLPATPSITRSNPASPSTDRHPKLAGWAEPGVVVRIFEDDSCSQGFVAEGPAEDFVDEGIEVDVYDDSATFTVNAMKNNETSACSDPFTYEVAPEQVATPRFDRTDPTSPGASLTPRLIGSAPTGSTVAIYDLPDCSGSPITRVGAEQFAFQGAEIEVSPGQQGVFSADASQVGLARSECSEPIEYTHDPPVPSAPTITASDPPSPSSEQEVRLTGVADATTEVEVFGGAGCAGAPLDSSPAASFNGGSGIRVPVPLIGTNVYSARAINVNDEASGCSAPYSHERVAPTPAPTLERFAPRSPAQSREPSVIGDAAPGLRVEIHDDPRCDGAPLASGTAETFSSTGIATPVAANGTTELWARAFAGNVGSACSPSSIAYTHDSIAPRVRITAASRQVEAGERLRVRFTAFDAAGFECRLDDRPFRGCSSPFKQSLAPGRHRVSVRAFDLAENVGPSASVRIRVERAR